MRTSALLLVMGPLPRCKNMTTGCRLIVATMLAMVVGIAPASAWWSYAEWGLSESQIMAASSGRAVPCRAGALICAPTSDGGQPRLFVESVQMVGMPASVSFVFDADGKLGRTIVLFPNADFALICNLLQGIHGQPIDDRPGQMPVKVWQDKKRGSTITATPTSAGPRLLYQPANRPG
jgi:hypothetical protein